MKQKQKQYKPGIFSFLLPIGRSDSNDHLNISRSGGVSNRSLNLARCGLTQPQGPLPGRFGEGFVRLNHLLFRITKKCLKPPALLIPRVRFGCIIKINKIGATRPESSRGSFSDRKPERSRRIAVSW